MRDLLSKLDALISETALKDKEDLEAKRKALDDLEADPVASKDPEISAAIDQRRNDLEKEAKAKNIGEETVDESGLQRYTGIKKYGKDGFEALQKAGREGADEEEKGRIKDKYLKKEDHGPENPDAEYNQGEYDREGDMAKDQLFTINSAAKELYSIIHSEENLPEWVQKKITLAMDYIDTARDYMKAQKYEEGVAEDDVDEAKYQGREVPLGKKMAGDVKKSKVYVRKPNGNIVKVNFGDKNMRIKKSNPARRKSFRARHNCKNPGPRWKARYWSCRSW